MDLSVDEFRLVPVASIKAPKPHEYIGVTGHVSKTGELNHLALVTWVLPVEAMDEESKRNFHENEASIAEED